MEGPDRRGDGELQDHATGFRSIDGARIHIRYDAEINGHAEDCRRNNVPDTKWHGNLRTFTGLVLQSRIDYHDGEEERKIWTRHLEHPPGIRLRRLVKNPHAAR